MTADEMVGWHHQLNGHKFEQALGVGDGQGSLACCSPWGHSQTRLSDGTELFPEMACLCNMTQNSQKLKVHVDVTKIKPVTSNKFSLFQFLLHFKFMFKNQNRHLW